MSYDLILKPSCCGCGSQSDLYGSTCKHLTLCLKCGKTMAEKKGKCYDCGTIVTRLIREYNVRASEATDKNHFIGTFATGLPNFKKSAENKWSLCKEGLQGRQIADAQRDDDGENEEEEGGLSKSEKELKKLLGKANGLSSDKEDEDDVKYMDEDVNLTPVAASKQKDTTKEEPVEITRPKPAPSGSARGTPTTEPSKGKRKLNDDDGKKSGSAAQKKAKTENEPKFFAKEERTTSVSKSSEPSEAAKTEPTSTHASSTSNATGPVTEDEFRALLLEKKQVTTHDIVSRFKARLNTKENMNAFLDILRKIQRYRRTRDPNTSSF